MRAFIAGLMMVLAVGFMGCSDNGESEEGGGDETTTTDTEPEE